MFSYFLRTFYNYLENVDVTLKLKQVLKWTSLIYYLIFNLTPLKLVCLCQRHNKQENTRQHRVKIKQYKVKQYF